MDAETSAFMVEYVPRVEREASQDWRTDLDLLRVLVLHHFNQMAYAVLSVCKSVAEFEEALLNDIPRFVAFRLSRYPFLEGLRDELSIGFALYWLRANAWASVPEAEREKVWHVGANTGEALSHAALKLRAEMWKHAAAGQIASDEAGPEIESGTGQSVGEVGIDAIKVRAEKRCAFVRPILTGKGWSTFEWATESKVDFHTADDYMKGTTNPYPSTRKKLATSLDIDDPEKLPP
jgi:hypothetical protein